MPRGDGTGPAGQGPRTGRRASGGRRQFGRGGGRQSELQLCKCIALHYCSYATRVTADGCMVASGKLKRVAPDDAKQPSPSPVVESPVAESPVAGRTTTPVSFQQHGTTTRGDIRLQVRVPADAKVMINGHATTSEGEERRYLSPGLKNGARYRFEVRAEIVRDGRKISQTKVVQLGANQQADLEFELAGHQLGSTKH